MLFSDYRELCPVKLPYKGRQKYMHSFDLASPTMPKGFEDYLAPVVTLCQSARATVGIAHMTVDEKIVPAGNSQRRPGPHVDGRFMPHVAIWGHEPGPRWLHGCNNITGSPIPRMAVIVAASVAGCRAWRGTFVGQPASDGDLAHLMDQLDNGEILQARMGYWLSPDCVHESMVFERDTQRTFLRIALPE